jgi:uncharacterized protein YjbI with pentapeptide repeats
MFRVPAVLFVLGIGMPGCADPDPAPAPPPPTSTERPARPSKLVRESAFSAEPSLALAPGKVAMLSVESGSTHAGDLGAMGEDRLPVELSAGSRQFCVDASVSHHLEVISPSGDSLGKAAPGGDCAAIDVASGVHTLAFARPPSASVAAAPAAASVTMFVSVDDTGTVRAGQDCQGCDLSGADLTNVPSVLAGHYDGADFTGARFDGSSFGCNDSQCASFNNAILVDVDMGCSSWGVFSNPNIVGDPNIAGAKTASGWTWPDGQTCRAVFKNTTLPVDQYLNGVRGISYTGSGTTSSPMLIGIQPDTFKGRDMSGAILLNTLLTLQATAIPGSMVGSGGIPYQTPVDFSDSNWAGAKLAGSSFTNQYDPSPGSNGMPCGMQTTDTTAPNLSGTNFAGADLTGTLFVGGRIDAPASFAGAPASGAAFCYLRGDGAVDFSGLQAAVSSTGYTDFTHLQLPDVSFQNAALTEALFMYSNLTGADFTGAVLDSVDFESSNLGGNQTLQFARSALNVNLSNTSLLGVPFGSLNLSYSAGSPLGNSAFNGAIVCGADFDNAVLSGANLAGLRLIATTGGTTASGGGGPPAGNYTLPDGSQRTCVSPYPPNAVTRNALACPDGNPGDPADSGSCSQDQWIAAATLQLNAPATAACCTATATAACPRQAITGFGCTSNLGCISCKCVNNTCSD